MKGLFSGLGLHDEIEIHIERAKKRDTVKDWLKKLFKVRVIFFSFNPHKSRVIIIAEKGEVKYVGVKDNDQQPHKTG